MPTSVDTKRLELEELELLMRQYKETRSRELRNQLVMHYSYIAKSVAVEMNSTFHKYATIEEMVNQGVIAIIDSIDRFNPDQGVKFSTYAFTKVRGSIIDYVRKQDWLPRRVRRNAIKINAAYDQLTLRLGRNPSRQEMATQMEMTLAEFDHCIYEVSGENLYSFETLITSSPQPHNPVWPDGDEDYDPESSFDEKELRQVLGDAIDALGEQERTVLSLYYYERLTMKEISQIMGVSEQRIGQVNRKLVQKLRDKLTLYMKG